MALNFPYFRELARYEFMGHPDTVIENETLAPREKMQPDTLQIASLGIDTPLVYADKIDSKLFDHLLAGGVVHYPDTAGIGEKGNSYIFGNSSDYPWKSGGRFKTIFALLPKIQVGDEIAVSNSSGDKFVYKVTSTKIVASTDLSVLSQGDKQKKILTLQTCWPVGTAVKRFIVVAPLEQ